MFRTMWWHNSMALSAFSAFEWICTSNRKSSEAWITYGVIHHSKETSCNCWACEGIGLCCMHTSCSKASTWKLRVAICSRISSYACCIHTQSWRRSAGAITCCWVWFGKSCNMPNHRRGFPDKWYFEDTVSICKKAHRHDASGIPRWMGMWQQCLIQKPWGVFCVLCNRQVHMNYKYTYI